MDIKKISLDFDMGQVCNDVLVKCFVISQSLMDEAQQEIKASIQSPDAPETRSIINRAVTEAIGNLKVAAQRYLTTGRTEDNNSLERLVAGIKEYSYADNGDGTWTEIVTITKDGNQNDETRIVYERGKERADLEYEKVNFLLEIPNWNIAMTDPLKNHMHKYIVDYVMGQFLADQYGDKAAEYEKKASADYKNVMTDLTSRDNYTKRKPSWT
jgi:hypothetical protein